MKYGLAQNRRNNVGGIEHAVVRSIDPFAVSCTAPHFAMRFFNVNRGSAEECQAAPFGVGTRRTESQLDGRPQFPFLVCDRLGSNRFIDSFPGCCGTGLSRRERL
jgi:hypothetical protein